MNNRASALLSQELAESIVVQENCLHYKLIEDKFKEIAGDYDITFKVIVQRLTDLKYFTFDYDFSTCEASISVWKDEMYEVIPYTYEATGYI